MSPTAAAEAPGSKVVRRIRVRAILFLVLALVAAASAAFLIKQYMDRARNLATAATSQTTSVVVAAMDMPIATRLTKPHLATVSWPSQHVPPGAFANPEELLGRTVQQSMVKGEAILATRLADDKRGSGLAAILAAGHRAMAVKVDQVIGVAGFVQPGDYVDVITTMTPDDETRKELRTKPSAMSKVILQNIKVLATGELMAAQGSKPVKVASVTLEVTPEQSERLALASKHGAIQLTMRSRIDQETVPTAGITPVALLSPDEGSQDKKPDVAVASAEPRKERRARRKPVEAKKPVDEAPVVEVLRGGRVETRKLRPSADSKTE